MRSNARTSVRVAIALTAVGAIVAPVGCSDQSPPVVARPTKLVLVTGPSAVAETMVPLITQPVVQAVDASGNPSPTVATVTAEVVGGSGGVMVGGSATSDAGGRAAFSDLTLGGVGGAVGPLTLQFSVQGLEPVTAQLELRCAVLPLAIGDMVHRSLTTGDCTSSNGAFRNTFEVTTSQPVTAVRLSQQGLFASGVGIRGPNEPRYAWGWSTGFVGDSVSFKALLPPGRNQVTVATLDAGRTGSYSLTLAPESEDLTCEPDQWAWAASPITTEQQLGPGDCSDGATFEDRLMIGLPPNASIRVMMTSGAFQPSVELVDWTTRAAVASATAEGAASFSFANGSTAKVYYLALTSQASGGAGTYTLSLNITYPPPGTTTDRLAPTAAVFP